MFKKIAGLLFVFLLCYGFFVVRALPATMVASAIPQIDRNVTVGRADGTVWAGTTHSLRYRDIDLGQLRWDVSPYSLFVMMLSGHVSLLDNAGTVSADVSVLPTGRVSVSEGRANLSVASILEKIEFNLVKAGGDVSAKLNSLSWDEQLVTDVDGEIVWKNAEVTVTSKLVLGTLKARVFSDGEQIVVEMVEGGRIGLLGKLLLEPDGRYSIAGSIAPSADVKAELGPILASLGRPQKNGRYAIKYSGRL